MFSALYSERKVRGWLRRAAADESSNAKHFVFGTQVLLRGNGGHASAGHKRFLTTTFEAWARPGVPRWSGLHSIRIVLLIVFLYFK